MIEVVNKIKAAEDNAEEVKRTARRGAAAIRDDAERRGRELLEEENRRAADKAAGVLADAQRKAQEYLAEQAKKSAGERGALTAGAKSRMDAAAKLIVERIVESL